LPQYGALEGGAEDMMAMLDLIDDGGDLAAHPALRRLPKCRARSGFSAHLGPRRESAARLRPLLGWVLAPWHPVPSFALLG
jgi:hypothetical protein